MIATPVPLSEIDPRMRIEQGVRLPPRERMVKTIYYFSYSGAMVIGEPLPLLCSQINDTPLEIAPARLGSPSFRATPQFTTHSFKRWFGADPTFPIQLASFAAPATDAGATINFWFGPTEELQADGPQLPVDTFIVTAYGQDSGEIAEVIEARILRPLLEWLRALTDQWWIGRSYERISGPLHFIAPVDEEHRVLGAPTPVASMTSAGPRMIPVSAHIWTEAGERAVAGEPSAERGLATDAKYMFISKEFRSGVILACCAFEAARDRLLDRARMKLRVLGGYDLRKHLSGGFERVFGRNIIMENLDLANILDAFWLARHSAAHGKTIEWRVSGQVTPIESLSPALFTAGIDTVLDWISTVQIPEQEADDTISDASC